ncbi:MAG: hypothetical protein KOO62_02565 [candidate division Zixibacteria bacterium]|nr:hypothetical protein [candidate division Zixibacteria bacterium]
MIGSLGVGLLLIAFVLNLLQWVKETSPVYLAMNVLGAGLAGVYAWQTGSIPFVILELIWAGVALVKLVTGQRKGLPE